MASNVCIAEPMATPYHILWVLVSLAQSLFLNFHCAPIFWFSATTPWGPSPLSSLCILKYRPLQHFGLDLILFFIVILWFTLPTQFQLRISMNDSCLHWLPGPLISVTETIFLTPLKSLSLSVIQTPWTQHVPVLTDDFPLKPLSPFAPSCWSKAPQTPASPR